jgi:chromosome segregation ATPase
MTTVNYIALGALLIAPLVSYLAASRRLSGKIGTSDAKELWSESRSIRDDYRVQIDRANSRVKQLEDRVGALEERNHRLTQENEGLRRQVDYYELHVKELKDRIEHLETKNAELTNLLETQAQTTLDALHPRQEEEEVKDD